MADILALDLGTKRIGVARADATSRLPEPLDAILVDGREFSVVKDLLAQHKVDILIIGKPRNSKGSETKESDRVTEVADKLSQAIGDVEVIMQDESLTSLNAEELMIKCKDYNNASKDSMAACIILQDYLESEV